MKFKKTILGTTIATAILGGSLYLGTQLNPVGSVPLDVSQIAPDVKLKEVLDWKAAKPKNDKDWAEDVKKESFDIRFDYQLQEMKANLEENLLIAQKELDKVTNYPDAIRYEIKQMLEGYNLSPAELNAEMANQFANRVNNAKFEYEKIQQSLERINKEIALRAAKKVDRTDSILKAKPSTDQEKVEYDKLKKETVK